MRNAEKFNPMTAKGDPIHVSSGKHVSTKGHRVAKGGAGKGLGSGIAKGYLISGTGDTRASGGPFRRVNTAKMTKSSKSAKLGRK